MSNTVAGSHQLDNVLGMHSKKHQWRRYVNESTIEQNASIIPKCKVNGNVIPHAVRISKSSALI